jgi:hypothetical protein
MIEARELTGLASRTRLRRAADVMTLEKGAAALRLALSASNEFLEGQASVSFPTPAYCSVVTGCSDARCTPAPTSGLRGAGVSSSSKMSVRWPYRDEADPWTVVQPCAISHANPFDEPITMLRCASGTLYV